MGAGSFKIPITTGGGIVPVVIDPWVRPAEWTALPSVTDTEEKFVGLHAVFAHNQNYVAFTFTTSAGTYTVDWGDGNTTVHASGIAAMYNYIYASTPGSVTSYGYKQSIITVTPTTGGATFLTCTFQQRYTTSPLQGNAYSTKFLDCILSMPNAALSSNSIVFGGSTVNHAMVEQFNLLHAGNCTSLNSFFNLCYSLQSPLLTNISSVTNLGSMFTSCVSLKTFSLFDTTSIIDTSYMFNGCVSLRTIPLLNTSNVITTSNMFVGCTTLVSIPLLDTSNATSMFSMFSNCVNLKTIPLLDTSSAGSFAQMFSGCTALEEIPLLDTSSATSFFNMFSTCYSLKSIPLLNLLAATSTSNMFNGCRSLITIPLLNTSGVTDFTNMFSGCNNLERIPTLNTNSAITTTGMFTACSSLQTIPLLNTASVTNMTNMFSSCVSLREIPLLNTISVTNANSMFNACSTLQSIPALNFTAVTSSSFSSFAVSCSSLSKCEITNIKRTISFTNSQLSAAAIVEIFNNLTVQTGQTITISGNWGAINLTAPERAIATGKGWTITG